MLKTLCQSTEMKMKRVFRLLVIFACCVSGYAFAGDRLEVYTVNYPLTYFAERIGGEHVQVVFPAPEGVDPASWTPDQETIRKYQKADLILLNGAGYEKWTKKVSLPITRTIDTSKSFKKDLIHFDTSVTHSHGPEGDHSHSGTAFTTWLDFSQAARQAEAIYKAFARKAPSYTSDFEKNFESLHSDLLELDRRMTALGNKSDGAPLLASHPIYQYMARRYNLNLEMVMWEPNADPGMHEWNHLQRLHSSHPAKYMIWEGEPLVQSKKKLAGFKINSVVFSPCFSVPEKGDFLSVMKANIGNLEAL